MAGPLNVAMSLSLVDTASGQVKAFIGTLEALEVRINAISRKLAAMGGAGGSGGGGGGAGGAGGGGGSGRIPADMWAVRLERAEKIAAGMNQRFDQMRGKVQAVAEAMDARLTQSIGRAASAASTLDARLTQAAGKRAAAAEREDARLTQQAGRRMAAAEQMDASRERAAIRARQRDQDLVQRAGRTQSIALTDDELRTLRQGRTQSSAIAEDERRAASQAAAERRLARLQMMAQAEDRARQKLWDAGAITAWSASSVSEIGKVEKKLGGLGDTIKGLIGLWATFKMEKMVMGTITQAASYESIRHRLNVRNIGDYDEKAMIETASEVSRNVPQFSRAQALELGIDMMQVTGSAKHAAEALSEFAKASYAMKAATPEGHNFNMREMLNVAKILEQRGATLDPERMKAELNVWVQAYAQSQGRVTPGTALSNISYERAGLGQTMSIEFVPYFTAMIEQMRAAGGNTGNVGTMLTTLQRAIVSGIGDKASLAERVRLGLVDNAGIKWTKSNNVGPGSDTRGVGRDVFLDNPWKYVMGFVVPALQRAKINVEKAMSGDKGELIKVVEELTRMFKDRLAAQALTMMIGRAHLIEKDADQQRKTMPYDEQYLKASVLAKGNWDAFTAQAENLAIVLGTTVLPVITRVTKALTDMISGAVTFFENNKVVATITEWALAFATAGVAVLTFGKLFGGLSATIGPALAGALGKIAVLLRGGLVVLLFGIFAEILANWEVGGVKLITWIIGLGDVMVTNFKIMWEKIKQAFVDGWNFITRQDGTASKMATDQAIRAMDTELRKRLSMNNLLLSENGMWVTGGGEEKKPGPRKPMGEGQHWVAPEMSEDMKKFFDSLGPGEDGLHGRNVGVRGAGGRAGGGRGRRAAALDDEFRGFEDRLRKEQDAFNELKAMQGSFQTWSIEETLAYWTKIRDMGGLSNDDRMRVDKKYYAAKLAVEKRDFDAYIAMLEASKTALQNNVAYKIMLSKEAHAAIAEKYGENSPEAQRSYREIAQDQKELATQNSRVAEIEGEIGVAKFRHNVAMRKLESDQDLALRKISNEQRLQIDRDFLEAEWQQAHAAQQRLMDDEQNQVKYGELKKQLLAIDQDYETKKTQLIHREELERKKDSIAAANSIQGAFSGFFNDLAMGKGWKNSVKALGDSIRSSLTKIASDRVADMIMGPGTKGGGILSKFTDMIFGGKNLLGIGKSADPSVALTGSATQLSTAAMALQNAASAISAASGFGGGGGGMFGGGGGGLFSNIGSIFSPGGSLSSSFGAASPFGVASSGVSLSTANLLSSFAVPLASGTDYVPRDMLALIHEGERVVPKAYNTQGAFAGSASIVNNFTISGPMDTRSQSQIAAAAAEGYYKGMQRIRR